MKDNYFWLVIILAGMMLFGIVITQDQKDKKELMLKKLQIDSIQVNSKEEANLIKKMLKKDSDYWDLSMDSAWKELDSLKQKK